MKLAVVLALLGSCNSDPKPAGSITPITAQARRGSATGYASGLASDLAREGITAPPPITGSAAPVAVPVPVPAPAPAPVAVPVPAPGSASPPSPSPSPSPPPSPSPSPSPPPSPSPSPSPPPSPTKHVPVKVPSDLAAIKLDMEPNWDRDYDEAGTISFVLKISASGETRTFTFHYGYDDVHAPASCDDYATWLSTTKRLNTTLHRQANGACYVEGLDDKGVPMFRQHVTFGGKPLWCGGAQYKDPVNNALGDLRDKVVFAAKKICGTLAL